MDEIKTVGVIGAGQMGAGIAQVSASAGIKTMLWDSDSSSLDRGISSIQTNLAKALEKGKITKEEMERSRSYVIRAASLSAVAACDLIIEAIVENFEIKAALFRQLDGLCRPEALLASNTSSISITRMAASTRRPTQFMGVHFMNPVPVMKLVELIKGLQTNDHTYALVSAFAQKLGKTTVLAIDTPGFIVNRVLVPMINEAIFLLQEGVNAEDIDTAMKLGTNQPMGPLALADFVGLDTLLSILQILQRELGEDKYRPCPLLVKYVEAGWYGKKTGRGFFRY